VFVSGVIGTLPSSDCPSFSVTDDFSDWNECSAACGYGERMRFDMSGAEQTMFCSLTSCDPG